MEAVSAFSELAYPSGEFPALKVGARCPFCQQTINDEAATRLKHFSEYITSKAQEALSSGEREFAETLRAFQVAVQRSDITLAISELAADDSELAQRVTDFLAEAAKIQRAVNDAARDSASLLAAGLGTSSISGLDVAAKALQYRATKLERQKATFEPELEAELRDLESRVTLRAGLQGILDEVERKKLIGAYRQCLDDTSTQSITRKSTELTTRLVTESLRDTFKAELKALEFTHLAVEVQSAGGAKGTLLPHLLPGIAARARQKV